MGLLLIRILFHEFHKKDKKYGGSSDSNNDRNDHNCSSDVGTNSDIPVSNGYLSNYLIVKTGNKTIHPRINFSELYFNYP
jgi:hypothetical protein